MAKNAPFYSIALANVPPRKAPHGRPFDTAKAELLFGQVTAKIGQVGSSDNVAYDEKKEATKAAGAARRLIVRYMGLNEKATKLVEGYKIATRVWGSGDNQDEPPFRWSIHFAKATAKETEAEATE